MLPMEEEREASRMLASKQTTRDLTPPDVVVELAAGRVVRAVWVNEIAGVTFEVGRDPDRVFVGCRWSSNAGS